MLLELKHDEISQTVSELGTDKNGTARLVNSQ